MRVLVIGGTGFLGRRTVQALAKVPRASVSVGYWRRPPDSAPDDQGSGPPSSVRIDLNDPSTFSVMSDFDWVVNVSDTLAAPPEQIVDYALDRGIRFLEAGAHTATMERLIRRTRGPAADRDRWTGCVVLGVGLFPGMSNLLAKELVSWSGPPEELNVVIRLNPLAGGGAGLVELMVRATQEEAVSYEKGQRITHPPVRPGIEVFTGSRKVATIGLGLPEVHMIRASFKTPTVGTYVTTIPTLPTWFSRPLLRWMPDGPAAEKAFVPLMRRYLGLIRLKLFKNKPAFVEVNAVTGEGRQLALRTDDGGAATAHVLAAKVQALAAQPPPPGAYMPDEVLNLGDVTSRVLALADGAFSFTLHSSEV
ncbi:MAG: hypothetical protein HKN73_13295 [Gemmatimonadetes bacterium]|nr:hypothetical protein [Gemmatimonadota bacterium]